MEVKELAKSWIDEIFGFSSKPAKGGGQHNTIYRKDNKNGERLSWNSDKNGNHVTGTGHNSDKHGKKNKKNWVNKAMRLWSIDL